MKRLSDEAISEALDVKSGTDHERFVMIAQAQLEEDRKQVYDWGNQPCSHELQRHMCHTCWQDLEGGR